MRTQKSPLKNSLDWPDVVFQAEAMQEEFAAVQVITLYSHCLNIAEERNLPLPDVHEGEYVQVFNDRVVIAIDAEIIDDESIANALDFLTQVDNFEVGTFKQISPKKNFNYRKLH